MGRIFNQITLKPDRKSYFPYLMYLENAGRGIGYSFHSCFMLEDKAEERFDNAVILEVKSFVLK